MAYRPVDPLRLFTDSLGAPLAGGMVEFLETGTTDPKSVYSDEALSVNLGNEVTLDAAGFLPSDVWGSGTYRVRVYDADSVLVDEADPITDPAGADTSLPSMSGNSGKFLTNNGTIASWASISEVPAQTGHSGKILSTDGTTASWMAIAALNIPEITTTSGSAIIGDLLLQWGTDTAPNTGAFTTTKAVVFTTAYTSAPFVSITAHTSHAAGPLVSYLTAAPATTGFTAGFDVAEGDTGNSLISATVPFGWLAVGLKP